MRKRKQMSKKTRTERWLPVIGYEGLYEVSSRGHVRRIGKARGATVGRILAPGTDRRGYRRVTLSTDNREQSFLVHRLVAAAFIGPCPEGHEINHRDMDPGNNTMQNLEYVTHAENMQHAADNGPQWQPLGVKNGKSKLNPEQVKAIRHLFQKGLRKIDLARQFGVHPNTIDSVITHHTWRHV